MSKDEVVKQLSKFREMLDSLPEVLISHHVGQEGVWLTEELALVRKRLEEELAAGKEQKMSNLGRLRVSLKEDELKTLESKEERRQQQLHSAILRSHLELQECVRGRAEQFVTSLASLTEKLLHLLDEVLPAAETDPFKPPEAESPEAEEETGSEPIKTWTWPGITHLFSLTSESAKSPITMTTAPISTVRNSQKHEAVIERRDTALKRFEQLIHSEVSRSEADRRNQLSEQQNWISYWAQQVFALRQTQRKQR
ncbi:PREDICTED: coiled-coil domain-containing protein 180 [Poecilia mexicana]|nr:PREDICTED: coiled-coil domain-containing protein 180 [Poecilia mexicana]